MVCNMSKVLVIGLGLSGRSAAQFLLRRGHTIIGVDRNWALLDPEGELKDLHRAGLKVQHESEKIDWSGTDLIVVSPGVPPTNPVYQGAVAHSKEIIGELELGLRYLKNRAVGITGSNGKTTTTLLIEHVLNHSGHSALAVGNVGLPLTSQIDDLLPEQILVIELSSWQLETLRTPALDGGAILNITPNHLDRHGTMESYAKAKINLGACLKSGVHLVVQDQCAEDFSSQLSPFAIVTYGYSKHAELRCDQQTVLWHESLEFILPENYRGKVSHDVENMLAAYALCRLFGVTASQFLAAFQSFAKPPHRLEFVKESKGIAFYNDSKATSLDAVAKAVTTLGGTTVLIAGGVHKGSPYTSWKACLAGKVRHILAIGEAASLIQQDLHDTFQVEICKDLPEAIERAINVAQEGDNVLLSPGCSSYDMFTDYAHRGSEFKRIVHALT